MALKKVTVCAIAENKEEVEIVRRWVEKWKLELQHLRSAGCGCCVTMYDALAPTEAIEELPENLFALSDWSRSENFNKEK